MKKAPRLQSLTVRARTLWGLGIGLGVGLLFAGLRHTGAVVGLERRLVDTRTRGHVGTRPPDPRIVLAVVTSADTDELAADVKWPWDLSTVALAFDWMAEAGVRAVAVDVFHVSQGLGEDEIDAANAGPGEVEAARLAGQEADALGAVYRRLENVVLAIELVSADNPPPKRLADVRAPELAKHLMRVPPISTRPALSRPFVRLPVVRLLRAATSVGFANADVDDDGTLRRTSPIALLAGRPVPSLSLAALLRLAPSTVELGADALTLGDATQRLDGAGTFLVNFRGDVDAYEQVRPSDLVRAGAKLEAWRAAGKKDSLPEHGKTAKAALLKGKIVVWGINIAGIKDVVPTPIARNFPGPEFQATVLDNLLHGDGRVEAPAWANLAILLGLSGSLGLVGGATRKRWLFLAMLVVLVAGTVVVAEALFAAGTSIDLFSPVAAVVVAFAGVSAFQLMTEGRRNKWLEGTFSQYLSPAVIEALKSDPTMLELGGREREITVIFSDVKSFTTLSEKLGPTNTVKLLNDYLTRQSAPVLADDGVIDKFIGDAVMAFFGDPVPVPDHAFRACRAALGCLRAVKESDPMAHSLGLAEGMLNRIGIASGPAVVGNMGSDKRFSYTAMGDTVNLSSRLEGANKVFGSRILLGPITYEEAKDRIVAKPLARLRVVGKVVPVAVYELLDLKEGADADTVRHAEAFTRGHAAVLADDLPAARKALDEAEAARPGDGPVAWLRGLIEELEGGRRPRPWDGIYVLDSK